MTRRPPILDKVVPSISDPNLDCGLLITFDDGSYLEIGFIHGQGDVTYANPHGDEFDYTQDPFKEKK